jgi:hypothetical protein
VSRAWTAFRVVLAVQAGLAGWAAAGGAGCGGCQASSARVAAAGFAFYAALLASAISKGPGPLLFGGAFFALGVHAVLLAHLVISGFVCGLCVATALGSALLSALALACERANFSRAAAVLPWAVLAAVAAFGWPRPASAVLPAAEGPGVRLTVFTQPDCPYCDRLRDDVLPPLEKEFGPRLRVSWRPAADLPAIRRTPTLVISPERGTRGSRVFEGLPGASELRQAIRDAEARP